MNAVSKIERVIDSGILIEELTVIPVSGATDEMILGEEKKLPRSLSAQHKDILRRWNGINMDIVRLYGCGAVENELSRLSDRQTGVLSEIEGNIVFGDDPAGYMYAEANDGRILSVDTSSSEIKEVADNMDKFFTELVFGVSAKEFAGEEWQQELINAGLI